MNTVTAIVKDSDLRTFRADLKRSGFFITRSCIVINGYAVTYTTDPR